MEKLRSVTHNRKNGVAGCTLIDHREALSEQQHARKSENYCRSSVTETYSPTESPPTAVK